MKSRLANLFKREYVSPEELLKEKIKHALEIFESYGEYFLRDDHFRGLLSDYERAVEEANKVMEEVESFRECYICSVIDKKGCCKAGLENEVTVNIALINMFLQKPLPKEREVAGRCFFVGPTGCKIFARPYLCREFFCRRLQDKFNPSEYVRVTQAIAHELTLLYRLCEYIKKELQFLVGDFLMEMDITGYS